MIYSFGAKNFRSFKEGMNVSFELNGKVPEAVSKGRPVGTVLGIKGANASGKTGVLKALEFIGSFAGSSFDYSETDKIGLFSFFRNNEPSEFYIDFSYNEIRYLYELEVNESQVLKETLYKKVDRTTLVFNRKNNEILERVSALDELDFVELRGNASLISTVKRYKFKKPNEDLRNVASFFQGFQGNVRSFGTFGDEFYTVDRASKFYYENPNAFEFAKSVLLKSDLGISNIEIFERETPDNKKGYFPIFLHDSDTATQEERWLTSYDESSGTVALYTKLYEYWFVLRLGGVLIMDEFDIHCHPMLLPHLIELFVSAETNPNNAQFIFTAHSTDILDYLGKYRVLLVNKERGESYCYRLDEIQGDLIRNDRPITPLYKEGKIGGIPHYG